ncbi:MAG: hypothetical protein DHS20C14_12550 [Phycisphaeraceae bacterium]|nr:MAG: hypothetical protein DHS20C14_12550 [Phycisphaeraceae bacterium]
MKGVIGWIKGHLLIVVSVVLIAIFLPAGFVGAGIWNGKIKAAAEETFKKQERDLAQQERVQYSVPAVFDGEAAIEETRAPNRRVTEFFAAEKQAREEQVTQIVERATELNRTGHELLVEGLFPEAPSERVKRDLLLEMVRRLTTDAQRLSAYDDLVRRLGAGLPPEPEEVGAILADAETKAVERRGIFQGSNEKLEPGEQEEIREELAGQRIGLYAGHAGDLTFYVVPGLFEPGKAGANTGQAAYSMRPGPGAQLPSEQQAFTWQWDFWVVQDILRAVALANEGTAGRPVGVPDAPIKRVDSIEVGALVLGASGDDSSRRSRSGENTGPATYTGRLGEKNSEYDVRMVSMDVIAAPAKLPMLADALSRVGFMTITDVDVTRIDPWSEIEAGYYFGSEPVAHVHLEIETVWLRSWTGPVMPATVREALGVVLPKADTGETTEDGDEGP